IDSAQVEKTEVELSSSGSGVLLSNASPEAAPPRLFTTQTLPPIIQTASDSASALSLRPPPSATYLLDVVRREPKTPNPYLGTGQLIWKQDGKNYSMHMDVGINILFTNIELYRMQSEGTIEGGGIKPCLARETRRGKSTTSTNFNYDSNTINFSSDAKIVSLSEGSQDRITVLMQLASVGNADPAQFQPGKNITIQVAEEKDAPAYQFVITDQETLDTKLGPLETWHIVRPSRPGFYSSRIDIWLAPELNWLPVQIRNTESNGAVTTQTIRKINQD
ncbi:MAG: hypothetical protein K0R08_2196, partial [Solimicrobium sp.]|nr:hypothetical protein [Solimicrobium sp.]